MEKILQDRLNHLKSDLAHQKRPKMDKYMPHYKGIILETEIRIEEVKLMMEKLETSSII